MFRCNALQICKGSNLAKYFSACNLVAPYIAEDFKNYVRHICIDGWYCSKWLEEAVDLAPFPPELWAYLTVQISSPLSVGGIKLICDQLKCKSMGSQYTFLWRVIWYFCRTDLFLTFCHPEAKWCSSWSDPSHCFKKKKKVVNSISKISTNPLNLFKQPGNYENKISQNGVV